MNIISFDGLNRSGKGTQISLLRKGLEKKYNVGVIRGDGSREGMGNNDYHDLISEWWVNWQKNQHKSSSDWDDAYKRLSYENDVYINGLSSDTVVLMDRCYLSRWFTVRQYNDDLPLSKVHDESLIIPNLYIILNPSKQSLMKRCSMDNSPKKYFRQGIIENWYSLWEDVVKEAEIFLGEKLHLLPGEDLNETRVSIENIVGELLNGHP